MNTEATPEHLSLIGMSGTGKSHWAKRLAQSGFTHYSCDRLIASRLREQLNRTDGGHMMQMAEWLGFPFDPGYQDREAQYLDHEIAVVSDIVEHIESNGLDTDQKHVVDTTGSVVYIGETLLQRLAQCTTIVYLSMPYAFHQDLCKRYIANPRPVLWRGLFNKQPGESDQQALERCYSILLASRQRLYEQCANLTINYDQRSRDGFDAEDLLEAITAESTGNGQNK